MIYLDSCALVKLLVTEPETRHLWHSFPLMPPIHT